MNDRRAPQAPASQLSPFAEEFFPARVKSSVKYSNSLSFCYLNARSLVTRSQDGLTRFDHLYNFACLDISSDCIIITETHLDNTIDSNEIKMAGYQLFRKDRNRSGGGVAIYIKDELAALEILELQKPCIESLYIKVLKCSIPCIIGVCYRPPNQSQINRDATLESLRAQFDYLCIRTKLPFFIFGDFNDRCTIWDSDHTDSEIGNLLYNLVYEYNLSQIVNAPTRELNLLDLLITNRSNYILKVDVIDPIDNLDHNMITGELKVQYTKQLNYKRVVRHFTDERLETLNTRLKDIDWPHIIQNDMTVDGCVASFYATLTEQLDLVIPPVTITIRPQDKPGMTHHIRKLFKQSHMLGRRANKTKTKYDILQHIIARRKAKKEWFKEQQKHNARIYAKSTGPGSQAKAFWKILKQNFGESKRTNIPTLIDGFKLLTDDSSKADCLNAYFVEQSTLDLASEPVLPYCTGLPRSDLENDGCLTEITVDPLIVFSILSSLNVNKATGPDGLCNTLLKHCASSLYHPISILAQMSLNTGTFPKVWKSANVVPLYKNGDKNCKSNYRPISLLSNVSKVLERLVYNALYDHCLQNKLLSPKNSGFKKGDGAINQMICMTDKIYKALDNGKNVAMVFLDISKAFDRVWHRGLLYKLQTFGVGGPLYRWFEDYLCDRNQKMVLNGQESLMMSTNAGVPQGSILGPLLFLIFINDIEQFIKSDMFIFADDTTLAKVYDSLLEVESCLNSDLNTISKWGLKWMVTFNIEKTVFLNFSLKKDSLSNSPNLIFNNSCIKQVQEHKHLGIILSKDIRWSAHISKITSKASQRLGALYRQSRKMTRVQIETIYLSMIRPILEYGSVLFANCSLNDAQLIESVQRRAAILCTGAIRRTASVKLNAETGWDSLELRRNRAKMFLFYQIVHKIGPSYLSNCITPRNEQVRSSRSGSRNNMLLIEPNCRINCYKKSFFPDCIKIWNSLSNVEVNSTSIGAFQYNLLKLAAYSSMPRQMDTIHYNKVLKGSAGRLITQFRLGLSPLRNELFCYNILDNPFCPACLECVESLSHYIFVCPVYSVQRETMLRDLASLVSALYTNFDISIDLNNRTEVIAILTRGINLAGQDQSKNLNVNLAVFNIFSAFIQSTLRFTRLYT